jgi:UDP-glucose 4-epimerase
MSLRIVITWILLHSVHALASTAPTRTVLVTGGAGYIGSHTCLELLQTGRYQVIVADNLDNSCEEALERVKELAGSKHSDKLHFRQCDIRNRETLAAILKDYPDISSCIHFAGLKVRLASGFSKIVRW